MIEGVLNKLPGGGGGDGANVVLERNEEPAKKFGIPAEGSFFCGVGGLRDIIGTGG